MSCKDRYGISYGVGEAHRAIPRKNKPQGKMLKIGKTASKAAVLRYFKKNEKIFSKKFVLSVIDDVPLRPLLRGGCLVWEIRDGFAEKKNNFFSKKFCGVRRVLVSLQPQMRGIDFRGFVLSGLRD
jgi:hypothetical protein